MLRSSRHSLDVDLNILDYPSFNTAIIIWSQPPTRAKKRGGHMKVGCSIRRQQGESGMNEKQRPRTPHQHYYSQPQVCVGITRVRLGGRHSGHSEGFFRWLNRL